MKKQYSIIEENDWEGETFEYVVMLTDEEAQIIEAKFKSDDFYTSSFTIQEFEEPYTSKDVKLINKHSENTYMPRIGFYVFVNEDSLTNWNEKSSLFYKGTGLKQVSKL